jgi:HSP20 family protein
MTTFRWPTGLDPFLGLRGLQRELERMFNVPSSEGYPPINVYDADSEFVVEAMLPGVNAGDLDLSITGDTLVIKGTKKPIPDMPSDRYIRSERGQGNFNRTVVLPDGVEPDAIKAKCVDGILTIHLPKSAQARSHKISVQGG